MAITLNKYAIQCEQMAINSGKINEQSSPRVMLYDISRHWRDLLSSGKGPDAQLPQWSKREKETAEIILASVIYLQRIGCDNIEQLLRDTMQLLNEPND